MPYQYQNGFQLFHKHGNAPEKKVIIDPGGAIVIINAITEPKTKETKTLASHFSIVLPM